MAYTLLTTKLYMPQVRPEWVLRPRLVERLSAGLGGRKLTLVSAPAGSGKTSLAAAWLSVLDSDFRVAWLSLVGFGCVLFTYFGVNFLLSGLHSYATQ